VLTNDKVTEVLKIVDKGCVLQRGRIIMECKGADLLQAAMIRQAYLGL
jgi:ABC-type lipopolysaccharide export system ATPase subunit